MTVILVRMLGPTVEGEFFVLTSLTTFAATVGSVGLGPATIQEAHQVPKRLSAFYRVALQVTVVAASAAGVAAATLFILTGDGVAVLPLFAAAVALSLGKALSLLASETRRGVGDAKIATASGGPTVVIASSIGAILVATVAGRPGVVELGIGAGVTTLIFGLGIAQRTRSRIQLQERGRDRTHQLGMRDVARRGRPYLLANMLATGANNLDIWVLALITSFDEAGAFGVAVRVAVAFALPMTAANILLPKYLSRPSLDRPGGLGTRSIVTAARTSTGTTIGLISVWVLVGRVALDFGLNEPRISVYLIVIILGAGHLSSAAFGASGLVLTLRGDSKSLQFGAVVNLAITAGLGVPMTIGFGPIGLAIATALGTSAQNLALYSRCLSRHGIGTAVWSPLVRADTRIPCE